LKEVDVKKTLSEEVGTAPPTLRPELLSAQCPVAPVADQLPVPVFEVISGYQYLFVAKAEGATAKNPINRNRDKRILNLKFRLFIRNYGS
jgi:hypothetical protein